MVSSVKIRFEAAGDTVLDASAKKQDITCRPCKVGGEYRPHVIKAGGLVAGERDGLLFRIGDTVPMCSAADQHYNQGDVITWLRA